MNDVELITIPLTTLQRQRTSWKTSGGVQYELNNRPEEVRIIEQRNPITLQLEDEIKKENRVVLVKHIIPVDEDGNEIKYSATNIRFLFGEFVDIWRLFT